MPDQGPLLKAKDTRMPESIVQEQCTFLELEPVLELFKNCSYLYKKIKELFQNSRYFPSFSVTEFSVSGLEFKQI